MAEYKEGVDFEWVNAKDSKGNVVKDGKGNPVKTRRFFKKSEKDAMKTSPRPKARPDNKSAEKPAAKPAKTETKPSTRPKANPARKPGGARPEGKASGMPAANPKKEEKASAGLPVLGVAAAAAGRKPATGKPVNPSYTGRAVMPEGFQGRYATEVARPRAGGGARVIGTNPARRGIRGPGGGRVVKMPDVLELSLMNKGGMVARKQVSSGKPARTYKK